MDEKAVHHISQERLHGPPVDSLVGSGGRDEKACRTHLVVGLVAPELNEVPKEHDLAIGGRLGQKFRQRNLQQPVD